MFKEKKVISIISNLVCLSPVVVAISTWKYIPKSVFIHFDVYGNPDWEVSKFIAFIIIPFIFLIVHHLIIYLYKNDRRIFGMANVSINYYYALAPVSSIIVFLITLKYALL